MKTRDYIRLTAQVAILKDIAREYSGLTIDNIITQIESRIKEVDEYERTAIL